MTDYERPDLASYASRSCDSRGRRYPEEFKDDRPHFERDRDRIIHCAAFRRLEYKTQVFVNHEGDYYRTRLTHSLEVAQIARGIARKLRLNEELTEAISLGHDLGHTPFGHAGEDALNRLMAEHGGFEHNLQSLRVVEKLEERYPGFPGLNLTWETREGLAKHSSFHDSAHTVDLSEYGLQSPPSLEAQIINLADEIAYNNHDIDDGLESGLVSLEELMEVPLWQRVYREVERKHPSASSTAKKSSAISALIGLLIQDVVMQTSESIKEHDIESPDDARERGKPLLAFSAQIREQNETLKDFLWHNLYRHHRVERMRMKAERYITILFQTYAENPALLPKKYQSKMDEEGKERVICDFIGGMTDRYALEEYRKLFEPFERV